MTSRHPVAVGLMGLLLCGIVACANSPGGSAGEFRPGSPDTLTVATATVPTPGLWEGTTSRPTGGFEFELARELAKRLGLAKVEVTAVPFQRIVAGDLAGSDVALSLITPTGERDRVLDFSAPYMKVPPAVLARAGVEVPDLKSARSIRWAAVRSTTLEEILDERIQPAGPIVRVDSRPEVLAALSEGRADAVLFDFPLAVAYASRSGGSLHVAAKLGRPERIAAALPQGSGNGEAVSSAIRRLVADGTVDRLAKRWLGPRAAGSGADVRVLRSSR